MSIDRFTLHSRSFTCRRERVDANDAAVLHVRPDLRDGQEEAVEGAVPDRLLGPVLGINAMRRVKSYPGADRQVAGALLTMMNVAKGGVSALLTTSSTPCVGS